MTKEHTPEEIKNRLSDLGVQIGNIAIEYIMELESKIKHLTEHLEPQAMSALFEQVEEEVKHEQRITELEQENKILRTDCSDYLQTIKTLSRKLKQNVDLASKAVDTVEEWKKKTEELEAYTEKMKCLNEEIIKALYDCFDYQWLPAHNGKAKFIYLQSVIDIVNEKFEEIKEK